VLIELFSVLHVTVRNGCTRGVVYRDSIFKLSIFVIQNSKMNQLAQPASVWILVS